MLSTVGSLLCSHLVLTGKGACDKLKIDAYAEKKIGAQNMGKWNWKALKPEIAQVWRLSLPAILTQITTIVMQYIDSAMVGALGANASASIGLVSTSTWLMNGITSAVSAGFSVQVAHHIGAGKEDEARNVVRNGMVAALIVSGLLCLTGVGLSPHLPGWLGGAQEICADASAYFMVFALMVPFSQLNSLCSAFLQGSGDMVTPSVLNAAMCLLDVVFNAIFIPHFGVMGAGIGTAAACAVVSLLMAASCCLRSKALRLIGRKEKGRFHGEAQGGVKVARRRSPVSAVLPASVRLAFSQKAVENTEMDVRLPRRVHGGGHRTPVNNVKHGSLPAFLSIPPPRLRGAR